MLRKVLLVGLSILLSILISATVIADNVYGEDDDGDGWIDEENPDDLIDNDSDGKTDEGDYGQYSITIGPIKDSQGNKIQGVQVWVMVNETWGYRATTNSDGQATFDYLPWTLFPAGTTFYASHVDYEEEISWVEGDSIPEFESNSAFPCVVLLIPTAILVLSCFVVVVRFKNKNNLISQ